MNQNTYTTESFVMNDHCFLLFLLAQAAGLACPGSAHYEHEIGWPQLRYQDDPASACCSRGLRVNKIKQTHYQDLKAH